MGAQSCTHARNSYMTKAMEEKIFNDMSQARFTVLNKCAGGSFLSTTP